METNDIPQRLQQALIQLHRRKPSARPFQGLNPGEMRVLRCIKKLDLGAGVKVSELSDCLRVTPPFITQMTNALVRRSLVDRSPDPVDRRAVRLRVTAKGNDIVSRASRELIARFEGLARHLGRQQSRELLALLEKVHCYFESMEEE